MKAAISVCLALFAAGSVHAQMLRSEAVTGALLGGVAGAVIGHNSGDLGRNAWKGAALGAGAGLIAGEIVGHSRATRRAIVPVPDGREFAYHSSPYGGHAPASLHFEAGYGRPAWRRDYIGRHHRYGGYHHSYGDTFGHHGHGRFRGWGHYSYAPVYSYHPGYGTGYPHATYGYYGYSSGAARGLFLGALAGGIIGHNRGTFGHDAWRGAAWGAGLGWLLGAYSDHRQAREVETARVVMPPAPALIAQPPVPAQPPPVTTTNHNSNRSPMSAANELFGR